MPNSRICDMRLTIDEQDNIATGYHIFNYGVKYQEHLNPHNKYKRLLIDQYDRLTIAGNISIATTNELLREKNYIIFLNNIFFIKISRKIKRRFNNYF